MDKQTGARSKTGSGEFAKKPLARIRRRLALTARWLRYLVALVAISSLPVFAQQRSASTVLVVRIPSRARVSLPAVIGNYAMNGSAVSELTARAVVQVSIRPDRTSSREVIMAEWKPGTASSDNPCFEPRLAESVVPGIVPRRQGFSTLRQPQPLRMWVRTRWIEQTPGTVQVASLDLAGMRGVLTNALSSRDRTSAPGALFSPQREMAPHSAVPLALLPMKPASDFGLDLEFGLPEMLVASGNPGVVTFTVAVF